MEPNVDQCILFMSFKKPFACSYEDNKFTLIDLKNSLTHTIDANFIVSSFSSPQAREFNNGLLLSYRCEYLVLDVNLKVSFYSLFNKERGGANLGLIVDGKKSMAILSPDYALFIDLTNGLKIRLPFTPTCILATKMISLNDKEITIYSFA